MPSEHRLRLLPERFVICRLPAETALASIDGGSFFSVTRTADELSLVCRENEAPRRARIESGWRALRVAGSLDFSEIGVLASLSGTLAGAGISIFVVSTFDTDYLFLRDRDLETARGALTGAGHRLID